MKPYIIIIIIDKQVRKQHQQHLAFLTEIIVEFIVFYTRNIFKFWIILK